MPKNDNRRARLADAGLAVLAREGARGLTHRSVDVQSGSPMGTTSNYFRTRAELLRGLVGRIGERLAPDPVVLERLGREEPSAELFGRYLRDIVARLTTNRDVALALLELRLEAARSPDIAELVGAWQRDAFAGDVEFNTRAGLPGGAREIALFHYAIDGLLLDRLTTPIDPGTSTDEVVDALVTRLLGPV